MSGPLIAVPQTMSAIRLHAPGVDGLRHEPIRTPALQEDEALVEVHAAAITRDELEWPLDRLPATPSYELSGVVAAVTGDVDAVSVGDEVYALTPFERDGVAAEYAAVPAATLAPKPSTRSHVESAAVPLPALSAWQGMFTHGRLEAGERVLVYGALGGVGQFATQLARVVERRVGRQAPAVDCDQRGWPANVCDSDVDHALAGSGRRAAHMAACSVAHDRA